jgi:hypothetical protein
VAAGPRGGAEPAPAGLGEQGADRRLGPVVAALSDVRVAHLPRGVDEEVRGPVLVPPGVPGLVLVVLHDRVAQALAIDRRRDVAGIALEAELGRVDADDRQAA